MLCHCCHANNTTTLHYTTYTFIYFVVVVVFVGVVAVILIRVLAAPSLLALLPSCCKLSRLLLKSKIDYNSNSLKSQSNYKPKCTYIHIDTSLCTCIRIVNNDPNERPLHFLLTLAMKLLYDVGNVKYPRTKGKIMILIKLETKPLA